MVAVLPVSAPRRLRALLAGAPDGPARVVHRGPHALYVVLPGTDARCVGVLGSAATAVPCGLRLAGPTVAPLTGLHAEVRGGVLHVDGVPLVVRRVVDAQVPRLVRAARVDEPLQGISAVVAAELAALPVDLAREPSPDCRRLELLLGLGGGLTPLGDDVVCGWLAAHAALGVPVAGTDHLVSAARTRTTHLSAALVECAAAGEVVPEFAAWVAADVGEEPACAARLAAVGHSSGAGLLHGARSALVHLSRKAAA